MDVGFTATMEEGLDKVAEGGENWVELLNGFTSPLQSQPGSSRQNMRSVKGRNGFRPALPECGKPTVIKFGKAGAFLACSGYPECRYTSDFVRDADGKVQAVNRKAPEYEKVGVCPQCGKDLA